MADFISDKITPVQRFIRLLKPDKHEVKNIYIYAVFNGLVNLSLPLGIQAIINLIQGGKITSSWIVLVVFVIGGVTVSGILNIFQLRITENLQQKIFTRASFEFAYRIPKFKLEALRDKYAPELMNRFFDIISIQKGLSKILVDFSSAALQAFFGFVLLSLYHPLFFVFSLALIVLLYLIFRFTAKRGLSTSLVESKHKYQVAYWLEEVARTANTFKLAGSTTLSLNRVDKHVGEYLDARENHFKVLVQQFSSLVVLKAMVAAGLLILGGVLVMEGLMNIGQFVAAEIIILMVMSSVEKLMITLETIYDVLTSLEKVGDVTDIELEKSGEVDIREENIENGIDFNLDNVSFSYPGSNNKILNDVSLQVRSGERILLSGPVGCGKSTILKIIAGLYDVTEGKVSYSGFSKQNIKMDSLRGSMGYLLSKEQIFRGSILDNITLGRDAATFESVKFVIKKLGLSEFIKQQPDAYNTVLEPGGETLSKSTVQKLLLARAVVIKPKLLIFRYSVENLEIGKQKEIVDFLTDPDNRWTLVVVSNNSYMASRCDTIIYMEEGKIKSKGNYAEMRSILESNSTDRDA